MIGYIGLTLLIIAYIFLAFKKTEKLFIPIDIIASFCLTVHAAIIKDIIFTIVNGFICILLIIKFFQNIERRKKK